MPVLFHPYGGQVEGGGGVREKVLKHGSTAKFRRTGPCQLLVSLRHDLARQAFPRHFGRSVPGR